MPHRVVILGGGFGGLRAAQGLDGAAVEVTLVDRRNYHLFQPLLYQVATGGLSPANIAAPLRDVLKRQRNVRVLLATFRQIDVTARLVEADGTTLPYDHLVVATGTENNYFGHQEWAARAPGLKSIEDATEIRSRVISAFEAAEGSPDTGDALGLLTFVVIGGGPTGVELAGAVAELARDTLRHEFRRIAPERARVMLLEAADRILLSYPPKLSEKAASQLARLGVQVRTGCKVEDIPEGGVRVRMRMGEETIAARTVLWSAGMRATPLGELLREQTGVELDRLGRVTVDKQLSLPAHPEVFVIGDLALYHDSAGDPLPATAPVALQQGRYVARLIRARLLGKRLPPFHFRDRGQLATVGRSAAVAVFPHLRLWGFPAWIIWLFVHLMQLIRYENRLLVFIQWLFNYVTRNRSARLITDYTSRDSSASTR